ncbi:MAG: hypothetical protein AAF823_09530, partial [Planctomycetota bacterium]
MSVDADAVVAEAGALMRARGMESAEFQEAAWRAYAGGGSGLVHAPTGTGKTMAAWLGAVAEGKLESLKAGELEIGKAEKQKNRKAGNDGLGTGKVGRGRVVGVGVRALWVTPL